MKTYFALHDWTKHTDNVLEAESFISVDGRQQLIDYFNQQDTTCMIHNHTQHTPNNEPTGDAVFWDAKCFDGAEGADTKDYSTFQGVKNLLHEMNDAANRRTNQAMQLTKVVFHKYKKGSEGPEHADIYPLATLLYLNDDYEGGELYFSKQQLSISPKAGSLLVFEGGTDHKHGVRKITDGDRYVLVAFWDYEDASELSNFWQQQHLEEDAENNQINSYVNYLKEAHPRSHVIFPTTFPILEIKEFVTPVMAKNLIRYMQKNHVEGDECLGPHCFPEYYLKTYGEEASPQLVDGIEEDTLDNINAEIKRIAAHVVKMSEDEIEFSKLKGHDHKTGAMSPPHSHEPAVAIGILALNADYSGGEIFMPSLDIEFKPEAYSLYVFPEGSVVKHGVREVLEGSRFTLVSHWQPAGHPYDKAGANI